MYGTWYLHTGHVKCWFRVSGGYCVVHRCHRYIWCNSKCGILFKVFVTLGYSPSNQAFLVKFLCIIYEEELNPEDIVLHNCCCIPMGTWSVSMVVTNEITMTLSCFNGILTHYNENLVFLKKLTWYMLPKHIHKAMVWMFTVWCVPVSEREACVYWEGKEEGAFMFKPISAEQR